MGEISDMISAIKEFGNGIKSGVAIAKSYSASSNTSLSSLSLQGTANFPVLVSDTIDIDDATMISKALERKFASFFLTVLTMNPYMKVSNGEIPSAQDYIKQFHQNMGNGMSLLPVNSGNLTGDALTFVSEQSDATGIDYDCWINESLQLVSAIYEGVNCRELNKQNISFNYSIEEVTEQAVLNNKGSVNVNSLMETRQAPRDHRHNRTRAGERPINIEVNPTIGVNASRPSNSNSYAIGRTGNRDPKAINYLADNDFKKANELVPTLLHVRVYPYMDGSSKEALDPLDFVIGIKATLHPVRSVDMITNIARGLKNDSLFFNFIRWTTGETKFFKDFLFALDQQKLDASNSGNSANGWWSALKRRKASSQLKKLGKGGKGCLPNATLVCSVDDLDMLKAEYGFDLTGSNTTLVHQLMKQYFLLSFVRVNPALQRVDFLFDGNSQFDTTSYSTLSKEGGADDKKFKDMMKMLGRGM